MLWVFPKQLYLEKSKKMKQRQNQARMGSARDAFFGVLGGAWSPNGPFLEYAGVQNDSKIVQKTALKKHNFLIDF